MSEFLCCELLSTLHSRRVEVVNIVPFTGCFDPVVLELTIHEHEVNVHHLRGVSEKFHDDFFTAHAFDNGHCIKNNWQISADQLVSQPATSTSSSSGGMAGSLS